MGLLDLALWVGNPYGKNDDEGLAHLNYQIKHPMLEETRNTRHVEDSWYQLGLLR
jgi:hypothetical protein